MTADPIVALAREQVEAVLAAPRAAPVVRSFFDESTFTATHVVHDPASGVAAIIDPVLDFDLESARCSTRSADALLDYVRSEALSVAWLLETHIHADHLTAAYYLQQQVGGTIGIGAKIAAVQEAQAGSDDLGRGGSRFGRLFGDGDVFALGAIPALVLHVPGHTPADVAYLVGDSLFVGDTMFMPDYGSARVDFPGGDARSLYRSVRRLMALPDETRVFLCHDYKAPGRDHFVYETTIGVQRQANIHLNEGVAEDMFVAMRTARDSTLPVPKLLVPSLRANLGGGCLPHEC